MRNLQEFINFVKKKKKGNTTQVRGVVVLEKG